MFKVVYEYEQPWPESGPLRVKAQFESEISVSPIEARRRANGFLGTEVSMMVLAGPPMLVVGQQPRWRVPAILHLPGLGEVATLGAVEIDALTGEILRPTTDDLSTLQERANAIATRLTAQATSTA